MERKQDFNIRFRIDIESDDYKSITNTENLKDEAGKKNAKNFKGSEWIGIFEKKLSKSEKQDITLQVYKSRCYLKNDRYKTKHITINANCKLCETKYKIYLQDKPSNGESKVYFDVEKSCEHQLDKHKEILENKKVRIAGQDKQDELAKSVLADHDGSSKKYYDAQKGILL